jgi:hypothetical protein
VQARVAFAAAVFNVGNRALPPSRQRRNPSVLFRFMNQNRWRVKALQWEQVLGVMFSRGQKVAPALFRGATTRTCRSLGKLGAVPGCMWYAAGSARPTISSFSHEWGGSDTAGGPYCVARASWGLGIKHLYEVRAGLASLDTQSSLHHSATPAVSLQSYVGLKRRTASALRELVLSSYNVTSPDAAYRDADVS